MHVAWFWSALSKQLTLGACAAADLAKHAQIISCCSSVMITTHPGLLTYSPNQLQVLAVN